MFEKCTLLEVLECLTKLILRIHYYRCIPGDGFFKGPPGNEEEADTFFTCLHFYLVAAIEQNERTIVGF